MLTEGIGQKVPPSATESKPEEESRFAPADGMARVEEVVLDLVLSNDGFLGMRQVHSIAGAGAQRMNRFTTKVLSPPEVGGNRDWRARVHGVLGHPLDDFGAKGLPVGRRDPLEEWHQAGLVDPANRFRHA